MIKRTCKMFEFGKRYRFDVEKFESSIGIGHLWPEECNGKEVEVKSRGHGEIGIYGIAPRWCTEIKEGTMKKSDLKTGMWVKYRNGDYALVLRDTENGDLFVDGGWMDFPAYGDDLNLDFTSNPETYDIMEVWQPTCSRAYYNFNINSAALLWRRNERTLTTSEAEEILKSHLGQDVVIKAV